MSGRHSQKADSAVPESSPNRAKSIGVGRIADPEQQQERTTSLYAQATQHEEDVETQFLEDMDEQRRQNGQGPDDDDDDLDRAVQLHLASDRQKSLVRQQSALGATTRYLMALHEKEEETKWTGAAVTGGTHDKSDKFQTEPPTDDDEENSPPMEASKATNRVYQAASVLKRAATQRRSTASVRRRSSTQKTPPETALVAVAPPISLDDLESGGSGLAGLGSAGRLRMQRLVNAIKALPSATKRGMKEAFAASAAEWSSLGDFFRPKKPTLRKAVLNMLLFVILPCFAVAVILYYGADNPPTGRCPDGIQPPRNISLLSLDGNTTIQDPGCGYDSDGITPSTSASWWVLFLGVRHMIVLLLAQGSDVFVVDFVVLQHPKIVWMLGPRLSLIIVQSKGWPSILFWWAVWAPSLLYGNATFKHHWLYWQDFLTIFTPENPSGLVTTARWFRRLIIAAAVVGACVPLKRHILALHLGRRLYTRFNDRLQETMKKILLVSELSLWARSKRGHTYSEWLSKQDGDGEGSLSDTEHFSKSVSSQVDLDNNDGTANGGVSSHHDGISMRPFKNNNNKRKPGPAAKLTKEPAEYKRNMDPWVEPKRRQREEVSGNNIIEFRQAFAVMTRQYFLTSSFGPVESREECIVSADRLFIRLLMLMEEVTNVESGSSDDDGSDTEDPSINLHNLASWMYNGCHDAAEKVHALELIDLLSPDHQGRINGLDFVRAIDHVYKDVRILENAINNASHIDQSYERVINLGFYLVLGCVVLTIVGLDVLALFVGLSSLILAFSFMIGPASATYFEGIMMVLARQPYDIGDKIAIANVDEDPDQDGSTHWMVESIDLVSTTARLMGTGEMASYSNGSLARCRLINMNRSPEPIIYVKVKFSTDVPYTTILLFRAAVERFVAERPQEWVSLKGFRTNRVESQLNFVEYSIVLQHRLSWQSLIPIKESKAAVSSFCVEIQKELGCHYSAPSMPVEITMGSGSTKKAKQMLSSIPEASASGEAPKTDSVQRLMEAAKLFRPKKVE